MKNYQKGQALLIVILVMTIALTVGLSVATRTITTLRSASEDENSQRAFSAAEAGIEKALQDNLEASGTFSNNTTYSTSIQPLTGQKFLLNNGISVLKDNATDVWLSDYPSYANPWSGTLTIYWGSSSDVCEKVEADNTLAALEVILITGTKAAPQFTQYALDPCTGSLGDRATVNSFEAISAGGDVIDDKEFAYKRTIDITSGLLMRIIPLYAGTNIAVTGCDGTGGSCSDLPSQGTIITSTGSSDQTERKLVGFKQNPSLPIQIFPYVLFSPK